MQFHKSLLVVCCLLSAGEWCAFAGNIAADAQSTSTTVGGVATATSTGLPAEMQFDDSLFEDEEDMVGLVGASVLGLQRSVTLSRGPTKVTTSQVPSTMLQAEDSFADEDAIGMSDVSVLGLQRSIVVKRGSVDTVKRTVSTEVKPQANLSSSAKPDDSVADDDLGQDLNLADASVLGLQRAVRLSRGPPKPDRPVPQLSQTTHRPRPGSASRASLRRSAAKAAPPMPAPAAGGVEVV
eukprot:TRINITY_DN7859_c0_g1_i3.p1 TRINITY_DN7859_c0_g1~~TRINITY_DN7859_c0_g1_i3.p1  ORF type:complete len:238 (+),score=34.31 TRINITY_DN7859_c0_g1_i3:88-801(+)